MSTERDLLRELQDVLASADVDVSSLVEGAWEDAREEVRATLTRLMARDLLQRSLAALQAEPRTEPGEAEPEEAESSAAEPTPTARAPEAAPTEGDVAVAADDTPAPAELATYVFGVLGPEVDLVDPLPQLPGGGAVRLLSAPGCQALVCDVDPGAFAALREPTPDGLELLAAAAHAHDEVLARFAAGPVLPLGLGTVLPDDDAVVGLLVRHADRLQDELDRVRGRSEWAVTVREPAPDAAAAPAGAAASTGSEYLQQRRAALDERENRWERQEQIAAGFHEPLAACALDAVRVEARPLEQSDPPLLHGVYLVDDEGRDRFDSTVDYLRAEYPDVTVEVTGPWPPYHFTALDLSTDDTSRTATP